MLKDAEGSEAEFVTTTLPLPSYHKSVEWFRCKLNQKNRYSELY